MKFKRISLLLFFIILVCFAGGCKDKNQKNYSKNSLIVWTDLAHKNSISIAIKNFGQKYPNVKVDVHVKNSHNIIEDFGKITSEDKYPNLICIDDFWIKEFSSKYYKDILDINEDVNSYLKSFTPYKLGAIKSENKKFIAMPYTIEPVALYYRKDIFDKYGIDYLKIKTWDDLIFIGKKLNKDSNNNIKMISFNDDDNSMLNLLLNESGTDYFNKKESKETLNLDKSYFIKSIQILKQLNDNSLVFNNKGDFKTATQNSVATIVSTPKMASYLIKNKKSDKNKWGIIKIPSINVGGKNAATFGGNSLIAIKSHKDTKNNITKDLLKYIALNKFTLKECFESDGTFSAYTQVYYCDVFSKSVDYFDNQKIWRIFKNIADETPKINYCEKFDEIDKILLGIKRDLLKSKEIDKCLEKIKNITTYMSN